MDKTKTLKELMTARFLRSYAGRVYYFRGVDYFEARRFAKLKIEEDFASATIYGSFPYKVKLGIKNGDFYGVCNCPLGQDGEFCKHLVALGLAYIHADTQAKPKSSNFVFDWKAFVQKSSREDLEKIVFEMSKHCPEIIEKYRMANLPLVDGELVLELRRKIDSLCKIAENCGYDDCNYDDEFYEESNEAIEALSLGLEQLEIALNKLETQKNYMLLFKISEYAIEQIRQISTCDEYAVSDFLYSMLNYYIASTCVEIASPEYLVHKIKSWEDNDSYCGFGNLEELFYELPYSVKKLWYEEALKEWQALPFLKMGEDSCSNSRRRLEGRLLHLARERKDKGVVLQILKSNLSTAENVLALVREYENRKKDQEILPLLLEAKKIFHRYRDIRDALVRKYQMQGNHDEAVLVAWNDFEKSPLFDEAFEFLIKTAKRAKCDLIYFNKALQFLEEYELENVKEESYPRSNYAIRSRRIEILLDAKQEEQAWELGKNANCHKKLKLRLAKWRSKEAPLESAAICEKLLNPALEPADKNAYEEVIKLLKLYKKYLQKAKKEETFQEYCQWLKTTYRRRKNLISLMTQNNF